MAALVVLSGGCVSRWNSQQEMKSMSLPWEAASGGRCLQHGRKEYARQRAARPKCCVQRAWGIKLCHAGRAP